MRSRWNSSASRNFASTAGCGQNLADLRRCGGELACVDLRDDIRLDARTGTCIGRRIAAAGSSNASAIAPMSARRTNRSMAAIGAIAMTIV